MGNHVYIGDYKLPYKRWESEIREDGIKVARIFVDDLDNYYALLGSLSGIFRFQNIMLKHVETYFCRESNTLVISVADSQRIEIVKVEKDEL